jgi:shikimate kinase
MGAGKSTVGRMLGRKLNRRFIDSDHALEERCGVKIPTIFEMEGESGFRKRESQIIEELTQEKDVILATGGGSVLLPENRQALKGRGTVIYLHGALASNQRRGRSPFAAKWRSKDYLRKSLCTSRPPLSRNC